MIFTPDKNEINQRLDKILLGHLPPDISRTELQHLISKGSVTINGSPVKASHRLKPGEEIKVELIFKKDPPKSKPEKIPLDIVYEDDHIIVINKPTGMVTHPGAGNQEHTLVNALLGHCFDIDGVGAAGRSGIVHRLDKDTSGVIIAAKNKAAHTKLSAQFKNRRVKKEYIALVNGVIDFDKGIIDTPLGRSINNRKKMAITYNQGRSAVTKYEIVARFSQYTFVRLYPQTGRTHQIRVHLAHLGYPIVGDKIYGKVPNKIRLMLHAQKLGVFHPVSNEYMEFEVPLPEDMNKVITELKSAK